MCNIQMVCHLPERMFRDYPLPDNSPSEVYGVGSLSAGLCTPGHLRQCTFTLLHVYEHNYATPVAFERN